MSAPQWEPVDNETADLLSLVATGPMSGHADHEWDLFVAALDTTASLNGIRRDVINPNALRRLIEGRIKPQRIGAFTHRALRQGLIAYTGQYVISDDTKGGNAGKPCRELRWIGGDQ